MHYIYRFSCLKECELNVARYNVYNGQLHDKCIHDPRSSIYVTTIMGILSYARNVHSTFLPHCHYIHSYAHTYTHTHDGHIQESCDAAMLSGSATCASRS